MKKILVIRLSSIGDIVLTSPIVRCIRQQMPGAEIHFAVKRSYLPVLRANPNIDRIHVYDGDLKALIRALRAEHFDFVADLHQSLRSRVIRLSLGVRSRGFPKLNLRKWILTRLKFNLMPDIHVVDRYFRAVSPLGIANDGQGLDYFIPPDEVLDLKTLPEVFRGRFIAFAIGARHATKRLPEHRIIEICRELNAPVMLLGGPEDAAVAERVAAACGPAVLSLCGRLSLNQSASAVHQAAMVITHDTGLMHIAAAFRKKIVSVWGNTVPEFGMYPYLPGAENNSVIIGVQGLTCRPCSKLGYDRCPKGHFRCMEEIDIHEVIKPWRAT